MVVPKPKDRAFRCATEPLEDRLMLATTAGSTPVLGALRPATPYIATTPTSPLPPARPTATASVNEVVVLPSGLTAPPSAAAIPLLTDSALDAIGAAAVQGWAGRLGGWSDERLDEITFRVADLPDGELASHQGDVVEVDPSADEFGWYVDPTPGDDAEYEPAQPDTPLTAGTGPAAHEVDLLSAVSQEVGAILGFADGRAATSGGPIQASLAPGERAIPAATTPTPTGPTPTATHPGAFLYRSSLPGDLTLAVDGPDYEISETATGQVVARQAVAATRSIEVDGVDYYDDTLTVDFGRGAITAPITDNGGTAGYDTLVIHGGEFARSRYLATNHDSGTITLDAETITYTGLEPITDTTNVAARVFDDTASGPQTIRLVAGTQPGTTTIDSPSGSFEGITFPNPATSLTINTGGGNDTVLLQSVGTGFAAPVVINGQGGNDTLVGPNSAATFTVTGANSGTVSVPAAVSFHGFQALQGGTAGDRFFVRNSATFAGTIDGGGGSNAFEVDLGGGIGPITLTDTGPSAADTLTVQASAAGDDLVDTGTSVTSTTFPTATIAYSTTFKTPTLVTPSALVAFIQAQIQGYLGGTIAKLVNLASSELGSFLDLQGVTLDLSGVTGTGTNPTGTVRIAATSAQFFPGAANTITASGISGSYNPSTEQFTLMVDSIALNAAGLIDGTATTVSVTYNPTTDTPGTTLATVASLAVTIPALDNLTGTVSNLAIRNDGFAIAQGTLTLPPTTPSLDLLGTLIVTAPVITFANITDSTATDTLTGSITLGGSASLSLGAAASHIVVNGFAGSYDLAAKTLALTATSASFTFGTAVVVTANTVAFALDPSTGTFTMTTGLSTVVIGSFVSLSGSFSLQTGRTFGVSTVGGTSEQAVSAIELGGSGIHAFFGSGGPYWVESNGTVTAPTTTSATGIALSGLNFGLALLTPTAANATQSYYALSASANTVLGVFPTNSVSIGATNLAVSVNGSSDSAAPNQPPPVVDFSQLAGGGLAVPTGVGTLPVSIGFGQALFQASGTVTLSVGDFVQLSGALAFQETTLANVKLNNKTNQTTLANATALTVGGSNVTGFIGLNGGTKQADGLSATIPELALALIRPADPTDARDWVALSATASQVGITGIASLSVLSASLMVQINSTAGDGNSVDFFQLPGGGLTVPTGGTNSVILAFNQPLAINATGAVDLAVSNNGVNAELAGTFAFTEATVTDNNVATEVIEIGTGNGTASLLVGSAKVSATGISSALLVLPTGVAGQFGFASLAATVAGISPGAFTSGSVQFNTTGVDQIATIGGTAINFVGPTQHNFFSVMASVTLTLTTKSVSASLTGTFGFANSTITDNGATTRLIAVSVSDVTATFGVASGTLSAGVTATGIDGTLLIVATGIAANLYATSLVVTAPGLTSGTATKVALQVNTSGADQVVAAASLPGTNPLPINFTAANNQDNFFALSGNVDLDLATSAVTATLGGDFAFNSTTATVDGTTGQVIEVSTTDATVGLSVTGASIAASGISGGFLILPAGVTGELTVGQLALSAAGVALASATNTTLSINTTGADQSATIGGTTFDFTAANSQDDFLEVVSTLTLNLSVPAGSTDPSASLALVGTFGFIRTTDANGPSAIEVFVSGASTTLVAGAAPDGVEVAFSQVDGDFLLNTNGAAGQLSVGLIALTRADGVTPVAGLTLAATGVSFAINTGTKPASVSVGGTTIQVPANDLQVAGALTLALSNFVSITGSFAFEKAGTEIDVVASGVVALLSIGSFQVGVTAGSLALDLGGDGTIALDASGTPVLTGGGFQNLLSIQQIDVEYSTSPTDYVTTNRTITIGDVTGTLRSGPGSAAIPALGVRLLGLTTNLAGLAAVSGNFLFDRGTTAGGTSIIRALVTNFNLTLGDGTTNYLAVTQGATDFGALLITPGGLAGQFSAAAALENVPGVTLAATSFQVQLNNTTAAIADSFTDGSATFPLNLPAGPFLQVVATGVTLGVEKYTITGNVAFQRTVQTDGDPIVIVQATNVTIPNFAGGGTTSGSPVTITNANGALVLTKAGMAGTLTFTPTIAIGNFAANATLSLEINNTADAIDVTGPFGAIDLDAGPYIQIIASNLTISFPGVTIQGTFAVREATSSTGASIKVIAASNVSITVGTGTTQFLLTGGSGLFYTDGTSDAGSITGQVQLVGASGITLAATLTVRLNSFATMVSQTFTLDGTPVTIAFGSKEVATAGQSFVQFGGQDIHLGLADVADLYGNVTITRSGGMFLVGVANTSIFLGSGPYLLPDGTPNTSAVGLLAQNVTIGLVVLDGGKYAFSGKGALTFVGLGGLSLGSMTSLSAAATVGLELNRTNAPVSQSIPIFGSTSVQLTITEVTGSPVFTAGVTIAYPNVFNLSGMASFSELPGGGVDVQVSPVTLAIMAGSSTTAFSITGAAEFQIGGGQGFALRDFRINGVSIFGQDLAIPSIPTFANRPLTATPISPYLNAALDPAVLNQQGYIDIQYNLLDGGTINAATLAHAFTIDEFENGSYQDITSSLMLGTPVLQYGTTYRYPFSQPFPDMTASYQIRFAAGAWQDSTQDKNAAQAVNFELVKPTTVGGGPAMVRAPPTAQVTNPAAGVVADVAMLNNLQYIDVTFASGDGDPIDPTTIDGNEITLGGTAAANAVIATAPPTQVGTSTYRYGVLAKVAGMPIFAGGELDITFKAGSFAEGTGTAAVTNLAATSMVMLASSGTSTVTGTKTITVGPLSLIDPSVSLSGFSFSGGKLALTVGINLGEVDLAFGGSAAAGSQGTAGVTAKLTGIQASFGIGVGITGGFSLSGTGKFSLSVQSLLVSVPNVFMATATGIAVQYDPNGPANQTLVSLASASLTFPKFGVTGSIMPYTPPGTGAKTIPGLVVREDGFQLGQGSLTFKGPFTVGSVVQFNDLTVGVTNFGMSFSSSGVKLNSLGSIFFATTGAAILPGNATFTASVSTQGTPTDVNPDGTRRIYAVEITVAFNADGSPKAFELDADQLTVKFGSYLTLTATNFVINTDQTVSPNVVSFGSLSASIGIGSLVIGGQATNFAFGFDGKPRIADPSKPFAVTLSIGSTTGGALGWPSWLPIQIQTLGVSFPDFVDHPDQFQILLSAGITGLPGVPGLKFSGAVTGLVIDPSFLAAGKFPIIAIGGISVSVSGDLFGGEVNGALVGGLLQVNNGPDGKTPTLIPAGNPSKPLGRRPRALPRRRGGLQHARRRRGSRSASPSASSGRSASSSASTCPAASSSTPTRA